MNKTGLTVAQLIEALQGIDTSMGVFINDDAGFAPITVVEVYNGVVSLSTEAHIVPDVQVNDWIHHTYNNLWGRVIEKLDDTIDVLYYKDGAEYSITTVYINQKNWLEQFDLITRGDLPSLLHEAALLPTEEPEVGKAEYLRRIGFKIVYEREATTVKAGSLLNQDIPSDTYFLHDLPIKRVETRSIYANAGYVLVVYQYGAPSENVSANTLLDKRG